MPTPPSANPSAGDSGDFVRRGSRPASVDGAEVNDLVRALYADLRAMAAVHLKQERPNHTLQPTALVHEAYLRLAKQHNAFSDRAQFIAVASGMMRRILVDHARGRQADKRGGRVGGQTHITLVDAERSGSAARSDESAGEQVDLLTLDAAMQRLAMIAPEQARIVELRFFGGLNVDETAAVMNIGRRSVTREWACAKAWLFRELGGGTGSVSGGKP